MRTIKLLIAAIFLASCSESELVKPEPISVRDIVLNYQKGKIKATANNRVDLKPIKTREFAVFMEDTFIEIFKESDRFRVIVNASRHFYVGAISDLKEAEAAFEYKPKVAVLGDFLYVKRANVYYTESEALKPEEAAPVFEKIKAYEAQAEKGSQKNSGNLIRRCSSGSIVVYLDLETMAWFALYTESSRLFRIDPETQEAICEN